MSDLYEKINFNNLPKELSAEESHFIKQLQQLIDLRSICSASNTHELINDIIDNILVDYVAYLSEHGIKDTVDHFIQYNGIIKDAIDKIKKIIIEPSETFINDERMINLINDYTIFLDLDSINFLNKTKKDIFQYFHMYYYNILVIMSFMTNKTILDCDYKSYAKDIINDFKQSFMLPENFDLIDIVYNKCVEVYFDPHAKNDDIDITLFEMYVTMSETIKCYKQMICFIAKNYHENELKEVLYNIRSNPQIRDFIKKY